MQAWTGSKVSGAFTIEGDHAKGLFFIGYGTPAQGAVGYFIIGNYFPLFISLPWLNFHASEQTICTYVRELTLVFGSMWPFSEMLFWQACCYFWSSLEIVPIMLDCS